jgi:hypothetical protein
MKFHLHVVDGNAPAAPSSSKTSAASDTAESSAVLLFAHLTLRCGHLAEVVTVSASTTPATARQVQLLQQARGASASVSVSAALSGAAAHTSHTAADASESDDMKVLQAAGAVLTGAVDAESEEAYTLPYATLAEGERAPIQPYAYFKTPFAFAEQSLRHAIAAAGSRDVAPYFDLIATTDMTTFEYVLDYYQQLRVRYGGSAFTGRGTKPVGVLHIVAEDPSRAARVLQRVLEMILKRSGWDLSVEADAEEDHEEEDKENEEQAYEKYGNDDSVNAAAGAAAPQSKVDSWVNYVDEAVHVFAQLFGVDVLVALV